MTPEERMTESDTVFAMAGESAPLRTIAVILDECFSHRPNFCRKIVELCVAAMADEREACAKVADAEGAAYSDNGDILTGLRKQQAIACYRVASAIRARSDQ